MTMDWHAEIADRLEAYVLGQLSERESREVDAHVQECASCARELDQLNEVVERLAESVEPVTPPANLRQRVLAAATAEPQEPVADRTSLGSLHRTVQQPKSAIERMIPLAAAAVLILAVGATALRIDQSRRRLAQEIAQERAVNQDLAARLKRFTGQTDLALSILTAGDMREIPLAGRENAASTAARAYWSPARGLLVVADRLPAPPPGRVYQVWIIENDQPVSAGLLGDEPGNRGMLIVTPPRPGSAGSLTVAVTDEPPGGLPSPSGTVRLAGSI